MLILNFRSNLTRHLRRTHGQTSKSRPKEAPKRIEEEDNDENYTSIKDVPDSHNSDESENDESSAVVEPNAKLKKVECNICNAVFLQVPML